MLEALARLGDGRRLFHSEAAEEFMLEAWHEGSLHYVIEEPEMEEHLLVPGSPGIVEPQVAHHVVIDAPVRFCVEFHRSANSRRCTAGDAQHVEGTSSPPTP